MKTAIIIVSLAVLSCGSSTDDPTGSSDQAQTSNHNFDVCPIGTPTPSTHTVSPAWTDEPLCTDSIGRVWPQRCAVCGNINVDGSCLATCTSASNRCTIRNSNGVCLGPEPGSTVRGCDSVQNVT